MSLVRLNKFDPSIGLDRKATKIKEIIWYISKMIFFLTAFPYPSSFKRFVLRIFGAQIGKNVLIKPRVNIHMPWKLKIGNNVWIGEEVFILNFEVLTVGSDVCISQRAFLCCGNHDYSIPSFPYRNEPITLKDGCWIGASCFVAPGTIVEQNAILSAGSMAKGILEKEFIYIGNPAFKVKKRIVKDI
tara:strand:- start:30722 stop:31282 length:561 start_codon:yes stop_codon:yes gene_type:complete